MYILLALIGAAALGIALHFALPHRGTRGVILTPGIAALVAAAVYAALTWLGWGEANIWLWVWTIAGSLVISAVVTVALGIARTRHDDAERRRLKIA